VVSIAEPFNYRIFERKRRLEEDTCVQLQACHVLSVEQKPKNQEADSALLGVDFLDSVKTSLKCRAGAVAQTLCLHPCGRDSERNLLFPFSMTGFLFVKGQGNFFGLLLRESQKTTKTIESDFSCVWIFSRRPGAQNP
jgi:hypothetical protein